MVSDGLELREPSPASSYKRVNIGDVGFLRYGKFYLLFSAGLPLGNRRLGEDVPATFERLDVGTPVLLEPRPPGCLHTSTIREVEASFDATGCTTT